MISLQAMKYPRKQAKKRPPQPTRAAGQLKAGRAAGQLSQWDGLIIGHVFLANSAGSAESDGSVLLAKHLITFTIQVS
jgi:hypothetical protein